MGEATPAEDAAEAQGGDDAVDSSIESQEEVSDPTFNMAHVAIAGSDAVMGEATAAEDTAETQGGDDAAHSSLGGHEETSPNTAQETTEGAGAVVGAQIDISPGSEHHQ